MKGENTPQTQNFCWTVFLYKQKTPV